MGPRWDPAYSSQKDFYNACYYSFRCCTTTGNGNGCYVSDNFGDACKSCLKMNGPKFVKKGCLDFIADDAVSGFTMQDLMQDNGVPQTESELYAVQFENWPGAPSADNGNVDTRSCWQQRGESDKQVIDYSDRCFEVLRGATSCARATPRRPLTTSCASTAPCSASTPVTGTSPTSRRRSRTSPLPTPSKCGLFIGQCGHTRGRAAAPAVLLLILANAKFG